MPSQLSDMILGCIIIIIIIMKDFASVLLLCLSVSKISHGQVDDDLRKHKKDSLTDELRFGVVDESHSQCIICQ